MASMARESSALCLGRCGLSAVAGSTSCLFQCSSGLFQILNPVQRSMRLPHHAWMYKYGFRVVHNLPKHSQYRHLLFARLEGESGIQSRLRSAPRGEQHFARRRRFYGMLERARMLSTRGRGEAPRHTDVKRMIDSIPCIRKWMNMLIEKAERHERVY